MERKFKKNYRRQKNLELRFKTGTVCIYFKIEMAAEIKTSTRGTNDRFCTTKKPILLSKLDGFSYDINGLAILSDEDGIITISDDK